jgi:hypothetical protein
VRNILSLLSGCCTENGGSKFLCVGPSKKISTPVERLLYGAKEECVFSTYYPVLINYDDILVNRHNICVDNKNVSNKFVMSTYFVPTK